MTTRKKVWIMFLFILILAGLAGVVDYPKGPDLKIGSKTRELNVRLGLDLQGGSHLVYEADVANIAEADRSSALDGVRDVIERRVNAFGVSEPVIQTSKVGDKWRVIVELAGVFDVNEAIKQIGETPLLEFREQKTPEPLTDEQKKAIQALNAEQKKKAEDILKQALQPGADFAALANQYSEDQSNVQSQNGGDLDFFARGTMVTEFETVVFDKMKVGEVYPELVETQYGYHIIKKTDERTTGEGDQATVEARASHILLLKQSEEPAATAEFVNTGLSGKQLKRADVQFDPNSGAPQVSLKFNDEGKELFAAITKRNVSKIVGIYLDGSPISQPVVQQEIDSGEAVITGSFTLPEAKTLAQRLNSGALPVPIKLVNQQNIGASLGKSSVEKSLLAGLIGILIVAIFMISYYRLPGALAVIALLIYSLIVLAIFKLWPVTLTLAGVAGFILSIGMAVDANVLIFERLKEEIRLGKPIASAIDEGFRRAWLSIRDSNVSSLITCLILTWFGSSLIKGFALTLAIGILVSMFSAITITRTFLRLIVGEWMLKHKKLIGANL
ncbi:MAG: protein translocase subunit SecD [Patescibacteria group bacterium]|nr:protein translocase subunit SecD [Patescibacteria group bacterium]